MKVLFINNDSDERCGIRLFGDEMAKAVEREGVEVTRYNGCYPEIYARGHEYFPPDWSTYDLVHLNWHPATLNHYVPSIVPNGLPLSLFVNDPPPNSSCPVWDLAKVRWTSVPEVEGTELLVYPIPSHITPNVYPYVLNPPIIGYSGIRGDGHDSLKDLCERNNWVFNASKPGSPWRSTEEEINRLALSTVNVCWYFATRGVASAPMMMAAARRPLLVNSSSMFDHLRGEFGIDDVYFAPAEETLEDAVKHVLVDVSLGCQLIPTNSCLRYSWSQAAKTIVKRWESII